MPKYKGSIRNKAIFRKRIIGKCVLFWGICKMKKLKQKYNFGHYKTFQTVIKIFPLKRNQCP